MKYLLLLIIIMLMLGCSAKPPVLLQLKADPIHLKSHVENIVFDERIRNHKDIEELNRVASYIRKTFETYGLDCRYQEYSLSNDSTSFYKNVICTLDASKEKTFVIGAHYDVCGNQEGADDNATGVSGILELGRLLSKEKNKLTHNIEFVAYTLEEPPFFASKDMGSFVHAQSIAPQKHKYQGMISLEMIGYFSTEDIQEYPAGIGAFYPSHANFIASVSNISSKWISDSYQDAMEDLRELDVQKLAAPSILTGVDFSDHRNYWEFGFDAAMITDTAFMRNKNYHQKSDLIKTLDFVKMGFVINGLVKMFTKMP